MRHLGLASQKVIYTLLQQYAVLVMPLTSAGKMLS